MASCNCDYSKCTTIHCVSCINGANAAATKLITHKRIWHQVRMPSSLYTGQLGASTSSAALSASCNNNWNQRSDRVLAAVQPALNSSHGNSVRQTLTSSRPGAGNPGGSGVDVKHDSYARYLNRKKGGCNPPSPLVG
jgi:hypothetical protein